MTSPDELLAAAEAAITQAEDCTAALELAAAEPQPLTASEAVAMGTRGDLIPCPDHGRVIMLALSASYQPDRGFRVRLACGCELTDPAPRPSGSMGVTQ